MQTGIIWVYIAFGMLTDRLCHTVGGLTFLEENGEYIVKEKSSLKGSKVKKSLLFKRTRTNYNKFREASQLGSKYYHQLPVLDKKLWMYNKMVGETQMMLCAEAGPAPITAMLEKMVVDLTKQIYRKKRRR